MLKELIEKINTIDTNVNLLLELHIEQSNSLTTYNDVVKFLRFPITYYLIPYSFYIHNQYHYHKLYDNLFLP